MILFNLMRFMASPKGALTITSSRLRLEGVLLPSSQHIKHALTNLKGIQHGRASILLLRARLNPNKRVGLLTNEQVKQLRTSFSNASFSTENVLMRSFFLSKQRLFEARLIRGVRLRRRLTNRGQRTKNNNKTIKRF